MTRLTYYVVAIARATVASVAAPLRRLARRTGAAAGLPGVNQWHAPPRPDQVPVVLVPGESGVRAWRDLATEMQAHGHPTFALTYGRERASLRGRATGFATDHLMCSAGELALFVDRVLTSTGASRVDLVGHAQGGLLGHMYLKWLGGHRVVRHFITLGTPVHGASPLGRFSAITQAPVVGSSLDALLGPAVREQLRGSPLIEELSATPDVVPGVRYTAVITRRENAVLPVSAQLLTRREGVEVTHRFVQDEDPDSTIEPHQLPEDPRVIAMVLDALAGLDGPADDTPAAGLTAAGLAASGSPRPEHPDPASPHEAYAASGDGQTAVHPV